MSEAEKFENDIILYAPTNPCTITFYDDAEQVGHLSWKDGVFKFDGDADPSAQIFFDTLMKRVENG